MAYRCPCMSACLAAAADPAAGRCGDEAPVSNDAPGAGATLRAGGRR